jgi:hypothetical protein
LEIGKIGGGVAAPSEWTGGEIMSANSLTEIFPAADIEDFAADCALAGGYWRHHIADCTNPALLPSP